MKRKLFNYIYNANYKLFLKKVILMESNPDFMDSTRALFDEMIRQNINKKYKIVWLIDKNSNFKDIKIKNVEFVKCDKFNLKYIYYIFFSKYIIDCNKYIHKRNKYQFRIHLTHGAPLKLAKLYCSKIGNVDYIIQLSDVFNKRFCELFNVDEKKIKVVGYPRNDFLFSECKYFKNMFFGKNVNKLIVWMPTYRNHKKSKNIESKSNIGFKYGVPVISNEQQLYELNKVLKEKKVLLLIKLHPAEDSSKMNELNLSNIKVINNNDIFERKHLTVYHLLSVADALITDYSSVYYDYLLMDKPIGLAIPDIQEYSKHVELQFDNFKENIIGEYIYNFKELLKFVNNVANNRDIMFEERIEKKKIYHKYIDGNSSKRVLDILINKMKEEEKSEKRN